MAVDVYVRVRCMNTFDYTAPTEHYDLVVDANVNFGALVGKSEHYINRPVISYGNGQTKKVTVCTLETVEVKTKHTYYKWKFSVPNMTYIEAMKQKMADMATSVPQIGTDGNTVTYNYKNYSVTTSNCFMHTNELLKAMGISTFQTVLNKAHYMRYAPRLYEIIRGSEWDKAATGSGDSAFVRIAIAKDPTSEARGTYDLCINKNFRFDQKDANGKVIQKYYIEYPVFSYRSDGKIKIFPRALETQNCAYLNSNYEVRQWNFKTSKAFDFREYLHQNVNHASIAYNSTLGRLTLTPTDGTEDFEMGTSDSFSVTAEWARILGFTQMRTDFKTDNAHYATLPTALKDEMVARGAWTLMTSGNEL